MDIVDNYSYYFEGFDLDLDLGTGLDECFDLDGELSYLLFNSSANISLEETLLGSENGLFRTVIHYLDLYLVPVISIVGLAGNLLSFVVFCCTYMRRLSSSIYLAGLCVADSGFLICILVSWAINFEFHQDGWCQTFIYLTYVSTFLSVWYVVSFTVERFIAVHFPLKRRELCTTRRAKIVVLALALFAGVVYSFGLWTSGVTVYTGTTDTMCGPLKGYLGVVSMIEHVDTAVTLILPFLIILGMNIKIGITIVKFYKNRKSLAIDRTNDTGTDGSEPRLRRIRASTAVRAIHTRTQVRVTKMLLTVSSIFLVLNLPRHTIRMYLFFKTITNKCYHPDTSHVNWEKLFRYLYYLHFSVNLFLYSIMGNNFRKALCWLVKRIKHGILEHWSRFILLFSVKDEYQTTRREIMLSSFRFTPDRSSL